MAGRRTLASAVAATGVALHAGVPVTMRMNPAAAGTGIVFRRGDVSGSAPIVALWSNVSETKLGTVLGSGGVTVAVIEHLMAALAGAAIDDCLIDIDGPEPPILDGDALSYLRLIDEAGTREAGGQRQTIRVLRPVTASAGDADVKLLPAPACAFFFEIDFKSAAIGRQSFTLAFSPENFRREIAPARTFGALDEAEALRAAGFARGASLDNTLVLDGDTLMNPQLSRFKDEFVRHKILDAIGDMKLAGAPLQGRFEGRRSSHALNNALLRALFADPANYEVISG